MNKLDIFGSPIQLRILGKQSFKTTSGSLYTFILSIAVILKLSFLVNDVYQRYDPIIIQSERSVISPELFEMNSETIQYGFAMLHPQTGQPYIDPTIYNISVTQIEMIQQLDPVTQIMSPTLKVTLIQTQRCQNENFQNSETRDYFLNLQYNNLYCISPNTVMKLQGDYASQEFKYFNIKITQCQGDKCKSQQEIDNMMNNSYFEMFFSDSILDPSKKEDPFELMKREAAWRVHKQNAKDVMVLYRNNYVESNFGWVFSDIQTKRYPSISETIIDSYQSDFSDYYLKIEARFERGKENLFKRTYKTVGNILSEIGGFYQVLLTLGYLIFKVISKIQLNNTMINEAFDFSIQNLNPSYQSQVQVNEDGIINNQEIKSISDNQITSNKNNQQQIFHKNFENFPSQVSRINQHSVSHSPFPKEAHSFTNLHKFNRQDSSFQPDQISRSSCTQKKKKFDDQIRLKVESIFSNKKDQSQKNGENSLQNEKQVPKQMKNIQENFQNKNLIKQIIQNSQFVGQANSAQNFDIKPTIQCSEKEDKIIKKRSLNTKVTDKQFKKILKSFTSEMTLSIFEYFKLFLWPFGEAKRKKKIIDYSVQKLYYHLDALNIIKKLQEIDKLKRVIMNEEQIKLFECLPKPIISSEQVLSNDQNPHAYDQGLGMLYQDSRTEIQKMQDACLSYVHINNKPLKSNVDEKLLNLLDKNIKELFSQEEQIEMRRSQEEKYVKLKNSEKCSFGLEIICENQILERKRKQSNEASLKFFNDQSSFKICKSENEIELNQNSSEEGQKSDLHKLKKQISTRKLPQINQITSQVESSLSNISYQIAEEQRNFEEIPDVSFHESRQNFMQFKSRQKE